MVVWLLLFKNISIRHESCYVGGTVDHFVDAVDLLCKDTPVY
jgi:hypothetical protein